MLDKVETMIRTWRYQSFCDPFGFSRAALRKHITTGAFASRGEHIDNRDEVDGTSKQIRFTYTGGLYFGTAMYLIDLGIFSHDAFRAALAFAELGNSPATWGDDPPQITRSNHRAPGKIFAAGRTLFVADPRRRDDLSGLPLHRVICTADPEFERSESLLSAPEAGMVTGDPGALAIVDVSALGYRLCAHLKVDPVEYLITPAPEGGWK